MEDSICHWGAREAPRGRKVKGASRRTVARCGGSRGAHAERRPSLGPLGPLSPLFCSLEPFEDVQDHLIAEDVLILRGRGWERPILEAPDHRTAQGHTNGQKVETKLTTWRGKKPAGGVKLQN